MDERQLKTAKKLYELIPFWDRLDGTEEELINDLYNEISLDPLPIIDHLLELIDDLTA